MIVQRIAAERAVQRLTHSETHDRPPGLLAPHRGPAEGRAQTNSSRVAETLVVDVSSTDDNTVARVCELPPLFRSTSPNCRMQRLRRDQRIGRSVDHDDAHDGHHGRHWYRDGERHTDDRHRDRCEH